MGEHRVALVGGGPVIRVRTVIRVPDSEKWKADEIRELEGHAQDAKSAEQRKDKDEDDEGEEGPRHWRRWLQAAGDSGSRICRNEKLKLQFKGNRKPSRVSNNR